MSKIERFLQELDSLHFGLTEDDMTKADIQLVKNRLQRAKDDPDDREAQILYFEARIDLLVRLIKEKTAWVKVNRGTTSHGAENLEDDIQAIENEIEYYRQKAELYKYFDEKEAREKSTAAQERTANAQKDTAHYTMYMSVILLLTMIFTFVGIDSSSDCSPQQSKSAGSPNSEVHTPTDVPRALYGRYGTGPLFLRLDDEPLRKEPESPHTHTKLE